MEIHSKFQNTKTISQYPAVLLIGFFDGMHLGHQQIFKKLRKSSLVSHVITFQCHPFNILNPHLPPIKLITTCSQKITLIKKYAHPNYLYTLRFSKTLSQMTYITFFHWIRRYIPFKKLILGHDSSFGRNREGCLSNLLKLANQLSFEIEYVSAVTIDNQIISSTYIRTLIKKGHLSSIHKFLGRRYSIQGKIDKGRQHALKYLKTPTVNLNIINELELLPFGVYAVTIKYKESLYQGIANLGLSPTFQEFQNTPKLEIYIFNFNKSIYYEEIEVFFYHFLREEKKFSCVEELKNQIRSDILICKNFFSQINYEEII